MILALSMFQTKVRNLEPGDDLQGWSGGGSLQDVHGPDVER